MTEHGTHTQIGAEHPTVRTYLRLLGLLQEVWGAIPEEHRTEAEYRARKYRVPHCDPAQAT